MISTCLYLLGAAVLAFSLPLDEKMDPTLHRGVDRATVLAPRANETYVGDTRIQQPALPVGPSLVEGLNKSPGTPTIQDTHVRVGAMDKPVVEVYDATKQVVHDGYEAGKQKVAEAAQGVKNVAAGAAEKTKETVNDARNSVADGMRSGAEKVEARP